MSGYTMRREEVEEVKEEDASVSGYTMSKQCRAPGPASSALSSSATRFSLCFRQPLDDASSPGVMRHTSAADTSPQGLTIVYFHLNLLNVSLGLACTFFAARVEYFLGSHKYCFSLTYKLCLA